MRAQMHRWWWALPIFVASAAGIMSFHVDPYLAYVATSWIIFGLLGMSLDMVWGRGGLLSLGQTAFYGLGGYVGSIVAINFSGTTGNTLIWSLPVGALAGAVIAGGIGVLIYYSRMGPLQSTILTYTLTLILWTGSVSFTAEIGSAVVGGDNGMSNIPGFKLSFGTAAKSLSPNAMLLTVVVIAIAVYLIAKRLMYSPFGLIIDCIRLDAEKTELLGYDVRRFGLILFMAAGGVAGLAGSLFGAWAQYLNPSIFSVQEALLVPVYVLVGGLGTLSGAFFGAVAVGGLSFWLGGGVIGGQTTLVVGACLIFLVLFLPKGIIGGIGTLVGFLRHRNPKKTEIEAAHGLNKEIDFGNLRKFIRLNSNRMSSTLETHNIAKRFGGVTAVNQVNHSFKSGHVFCLIGPNGAGKSSYLKICTGAYKADKGEVLLNGQDVTRSNPFARVNLGMGIKNQKAQVFHELSVKQNLWVSAYGKNRNAHKAEDMADEMLHMLGIATLSSRPASELSHGQQQWLDIGMVICLSPGVVLLDEPAAGMTQMERRQLSKLVKLLSESAAVIVVEHDMGFVRSLDTMITVLHQGSIFAHGDMEELRKDERILDIYLGRDKNV